MGTYTQILYQIVFSTYKRERTLNKNNRPKLFADIYGILKNKNCFVHQINGVEDHIHILTHVHPTLSVSSLIKDIKLGSNNYIKRHQIFPDFKGWQDGYGAFSYSISSKDNLIRYIKNQEIHHQSISFEDELKELLKEHQIEFDEKYLF
jgi:putative transposase